VSKKQQKLKTEQEPKTETVSASTVQKVDSRPCRLTAMRVLGEPGRYVAGVEPQSMFPTLRGQKVVDIVSVAGVVHVVYANGAYEEYDAAAVCLFYEPCEPEKQ